MQCYYLSPLKMITFVVHFLPLQVSHSRWFGGVLLIKGCHRFACGKGIIRATFKSVNI